MRLIDANNLFKRACNTPLYDNQDEDIFLDLILDSKEIDPVHAAGAVYCKECKYHDDEVYPGSEWELNEHQECWCNWWDNVMPLDGFCSEGRKDNTKDE